MLTQLIEDYQDNDSPDAKEALKQWNIERDILRLEYHILLMLNASSNLFLCLSFRQSTKRVFNQQFGSVFRTYNNPTYFSRRLFRFADIYTSNLTNLLNYSVSHTFYPRRGVMPHEYISYFM